MKWIKTAANISYEQFKKTTESNFIENPLSLHIFLSYNESNITFLISPYNIKLYSEEQLKTFNNLSLWMIEEEIPK